MGNAPSKSSGGKPRRGARSVDENGLAGSNEGEEPVRTTVDEQQQSHGAGNKGPP
ncbi:hypothetical protein FB639_005305, partial [Coemansia asiatica]